MRNETSDGMRDYIDEVHLLVGQCFSEVFRSFSTDVVVA
jgi:hypothetical protein